MDLKNDIQNILKKHENEFLEMSEYIYYHPELKFEEFESSQYYIEKAKKFGFDVNTSIPNLPTAFIASYGKGEKHVGFLGEFDALPDLYQTPNVAYKDDEGKKVGHGCGHNLLGMGSFISAVLVKELIEQHDLNIRVSFYGCPGEEIGSGKTYMVRDGVFNDLDLAFTWHPSPSNSIMTQSSLAYVLVDFNFKGLSSHAANGGINIVAASEAILPIIPTKTITYVTRLGGALLIVRLIVYSNNPTFSANPTPIIIANTNPNGAKLVKFVSILVNMYSIPSLENKFLTTKTSLLPGGCTFAPFKLKIQDIIIVNNAK